MEGGRKFEGESGRRIRQTELRKKKRDFKEYC